MHYTANPEQDYERHAADGDAVEARIDHDRERWTEIIEDGFESFGQVPQIYGATVSFQSFKETVSDLVGEDDVFSELVAVLQTSECPKVKALRASMQTKWVGLWADVLAAEAEPAYPPRNLPGAQAQRLNDVFNSMGFPTLQKNAVFSAAMADMGRAEL